MPGFDGTGPLGRGPMSGQDRGFCILEVQRILRVNCRVLQDCKVCLLVEEVIILKNPERR